LEFSFDRSKEAQLRNNSQTQNGPVPKLPTPPVMVARETTANESERISHPDGIDTSTIANERLRKAIEKNRARQAERARMNPAPASSEPQENVQASFFEKQQDEPAEEPVRTHAKERVHDAPKSSGVVTRRNAARPNEAEFTPVKRTSRKVSAQISYSTSGRKKSKPLDPVFVGYLIKGSWIFCGIMVLRLIFANGGVSDFYSQRSLYNNRLEELGRIKKENMVLVQEIERMQTDASFQKKLVRDNLGFIASDEYLILFPKEKLSQ
jgi:cell division protein FtsB